MLKHDKKHSEAHRYSIDDFHLFLRHRRNENTIYWEFLKDERNKVHHEFSSSEFETCYTHRGYTDRGLSYERLCTKHGEYISVDWQEDGQCGFNFLRVALEWWEVNLRVMEQAIKVGEQKPFSRDYQTFRRLLGESLGDESAIILS